MIYPKFLEKGDTIAVTAPSDGNRKEMDFQRLDLAIENIEKQGILVKETANVRTSDQRGRSSSKEERCQQLMDCFMNPDIKMIYAAKGGDFLMEVLSLLDWDAIQKNPKWFQGFSDNTGLTYLLTTMLDMASIYGNHFNDYAMNPWHPAVSNNFNLIVGKEIVQNTFDGYEDGFYDKTLPTDGYQCDKISKPVLLGDKNKEKIEGRMIGGCLDVLLNLVGTRFDYTTTFVERYKEDGILWYLESFSLDSDSLSRGLWQLKEAGWFKYAKGFIFGRPCMFESYTDHTYEEAVLTILEDLQVPIILDADIGHKCPQFSIINGSYGIFEYQKNKLQLSIKLI